MRIRIIISVFLFPIVLMAAYPHKAHSVLKDGKWFRISVQKTGIYQITYADFVAMGFDPAKLDPSKIAVYGNGGGMLPESNAVSRPDDLVENAIVVSDGGDGKLDPGDYVLFYGESPDTWAFDYTNLSFSHQKNLYSDSSFYYITEGTSSGKRIQDIPMPTAPSVHSSREFTDHVCHEIDSVSLNQSGKTWVGESFSSVKTSLNLSFPFPDIDSVYFARVVAHVLGKSSQNSRFQLSGPGNFNLYLDLNGINPVYTDLAATESTNSGNLFNPHSPVNLTLTYLPDEASAVGWLDYIEISCQRKLTFPGPMLSFRDPKTIPNPVSRFMMTGTNADVIVWDVTKASDAGRMSTVRTDSTLWFQAETDSLKEFIAFDGSSYYPVHLSGAVPNQDLHGLTPANLVILTPDLFREQADSLAEFHRIHNSISAEVVDLDPIFTEFGFGRRDITAIRDFMKMLYDKGYPASSPRYLLLFGDGTYDPKNRIPANNNFIPPYESDEYLSATNSYVSDDYYGIMGDTEGNAMNGTIETGIGRLPVNTVQQAKDILHKIIRYSSRNDSTMADWKNTITFVADDPDGNEHLHQAERLADTVKEKYPVFNVKKIFNDAYRFSNSPSGLRSPDCTRSITKAVQDGTLVFSYTGHGGEDGWSGTKILTMTDINGWNNSCRLPVFLTATCEFGRFDNPNRPTGGELILTKPDGGGIAIFTTTRKAFANENIRLAASFFSHLKSPDGSANQKMGDLMRLVKNDNNNSLFLRNFVLLGDPAQDIAFPEQQAVTTLVNGQAAGMGSDTLRALMKVTVKGEIRDIQGNKRMDYSGLVYPKVFDKPVSYSTIGNTPDSYPQPFLQQNRLLFSGTTRVENGDFEFSFIVPRDIGVQYGAGKISYYSHDSLTDANGFYSNLIIGGENPAGDTVVNGPLISLFMDNTRFLSGGLTGRSPSLLAYLKDDAGINNFDLGIGHDITAVLDNDDAHTLVLNDYYTTDTNSYSSGSINYPFQNLNPGFHSLRLKAWNVYDISSEKEIYFRVSDQQVPALQWVSTIPNPLRTETRFVFSSLNLTGDVDVEIRIFSFTGQLVKSILMKTTLSAGEVQVIPWDGNGESGRTLSNGVYPYRILLKSGNGGFAQAVGKIVVLK